MLTPSFIIICGCRTGSTVFRRGLDAHPDLQVEDELLCFNEVSSAYCTQLRHIICAQLGITVSGPDSNLIPLLEEIFERYNGFKIQITDDQIRITGFSDNNVYRNPAWDYLRQKKIIHIRRNKLQQYISMAVAEAHNIWHVHGASPQHAPIRIDIARMLEYISKWIILDQYFMDFFCDSDYLALENIVDDIPAALKRAQEFLGVKVVDLPLLENRSITQKPADIITNWEEVRRTMSDVGYGSMLL